MDPNLLLIPEKRGLIYCRTKVFLYLLFFKYPAFGRGLNIFLPGKFLYRPPHIVIIWHIFHGTSKWGLLRLLWNFFFQNRYSHSTSLSRHLRVEVSEVSNCIVVISQASYSSENISNAGCSAVVANYSNIEASQAGSAISVMRLYILM